MRDAVGDPSLVLLQACVDLLRRSPTITALIADRIYSRPPAQRELTFPYVLIDSVQTVDAGAEFQEDAVEALLDLHVWSRVNGPDEAARIASAIKRALHKPDVLPVVAGPWTFLDLMVESVRHVKDKDGDTRQAIVSIRAIIDPA